MIHFPIHINWTKAMDIMFTWFLLSIVTTMIVTILIKNGKGDEEDD